MPRPTCSTIRWEPRVAPGGMLTALLFGDERRHPALQGVAPGSAAHAATLGDFISEPFIRYGT